jgi:hypothetical protein
MARSYNSAWEKIRRVNEQIINLNREIDAFFDTPADQIQRVTYCIDLEAFERTSELHRGKQVPLRFSVLAGEILYNLRYALDHVATQLVRSASGTVSKRTQFPIFTDDPATNERVARGYNRCIEGIPLGAQAVIEQLQPYWRRERRPHEDPLAVLSELCNRDKHRELNLTVILNSWAFTDLVFARIPKDETKANGPPLFKDVTVNVGGDATAHITLKEPAWPDEFPRPSLVQTLEKLLHDVRDVVAIFTTMFPEPVE